VLTGEVLGSGEGVWDGYIGYWVGLLFAFSLTRLSPAEGIWSVCSGWVECIVDSMYDEISRYTHLDPMSNVLCAVKLSNAQVTEETRRRRPTTCHIEQRPNLTSPTISQI
jgi:hypothetical protein